MAFGYKSLNPIKFITVAWKRAAPSPAPSSPRKLPPLPLPLRICVRGKPSLRTRFFNDANLNAAHTCMGDAVEGERVHCTSAHYPSGGILLQARRSQQEGGRATGSASKQLSSQLHPAIRHHPTVMHASAPCGLPVLGRQEEQGVHPHHTMDYGGFVPLDLQVLRDQHCTTKIPQVSCVEAGWLLKGSREQGCL